MLRPFDNVKKVALINFFASLYFYLPVLTIYYQSRGLNFVQINSLWGIITGTIFLSEVPTGVIADKIGRKVSVIIALVLQLLGEIFFLFAQNYLHFIFISVVAGLGFAFQSGCIQALIYDSLKQNHRQDQMKQATGTIGAFFQAGHILGALASILIISQLSPFRIQIAIIFTIISVAIALLISFLLKEPKLTYEHTEKSPLRLIANSLALISRNSSLKRIVLLGVFTTPFIGYLRNFQPPYFQLSHVPPLWLGIALAVGGSIAVLTSKYAYLFEKQLGVNTGMFLATILPGILYIIMALVIHPVVAVVLFILNFGSMSLQDPLFADYYNLHLHSESRATALSTINMVSSAYIAIMGLLIGWIADRNLLYSFAFMGIIVLIGASIFRINQAHLATVKRT